MTFRKFDTCTWVDPWFEGLVPNEKLAFVYFWTNEHCNQAGIYTISSERIKFELGYSIDTVYEAIKCKVEWFPDKSTVWVKNFFKHQCQNSKFAIAALNSISKDKFKLQLFINYNKQILEGYNLDLFGYHIDTV